MSWSHAKFAKYAKWPPSFPLRTLRTLREVESPRSVSQASTWITVKNADAPRAAMPTPHHRSARSTARHTCRALASLKGDTEQLAESAIGMRAAFFHPLADRADLLTVEIEI